MELPCRGCLDAQEELQEVTHPLSNFACRDAGCKKGWAEISRGQHLLCLHCLREPGIRMDGEIMFCDACRNLKAKVQFSIAEEQRWTDDTEKSSTCLRGEGQMEAKQCNPCLQGGRHWLASGSDGNEHLKINDDSESPMMTCYRGVALKENPNLMLEKHKRQVCKRTLPWSAYDPILLGWIIQHEKKRRFSEKREVYCDDCKNPPCAKCSIRPWKLPTATHLYDERYVCQSCRYPPCAGGCGTPRPQTHIRHSVFNVPQ